jgi:hypothetical protein
MPEGTLDYSGRVRLETSRFSPIRRNMTDFIREREIFAECVELPASERPAFVQSACGGNSELEKGSSG